MMLLARSNSAFLALLALALLILFSLAKSQANPADPAAANAAYEAKDWKRSAALYNQVTLVDPKNARAWYRLGVSLRQAGDPSQSLIALRKAADAGTPLPFAEYQMSLAYAALHDLEKTMTYLQKATADGFAQPEQMQSDPELQSIRNDSRFSNFVEAAKHNEKPCDYAAENRQFDFWLGQWNVVATSDNATAGTSHIEKILDGCVIQENWTSANLPYRGKSYNTYNSNLKRWEQFWADNSQGMIHFYGSLKNGVMDYWTDPVPQPDGKMLKRHLQFIPLGPDKVRQFSQGTNDDGKTWFVEYDFTYSRANKGSSAK